MANVRSVTSKSLENATIEAVASLTEEEKRESERLEKEAREAIRRQGAEELALGSINELLEHAHIYFQAGEFTQAEEQINEMQSQLQNLSDSTNYKPVRLEMHCLKAEIYLAKKQLREAEIEINTADGHKTSCVLFAIPNPFLPEDKYSQVEYERLAQFELLAGHIKLLNNISGENSIAALQKAIRVFAYYEKHEKLIEALILLGTAHLKENNYAAAEEQFKKVQTLKLNNLTYPLLEAGLGELYRHYYIVNESANGCELVSTQVAPTLATLSKLAIQGNAAFIRCGEKLFYVNQQQKTCDSINLSPEKRTQLDNQFPAEEKSRVLTPEEKHKLSKITQYHWGKDEAKRHYAAALSAENQSGNTLATLIARNGLATLFYSLDHDWGYTIFHLTSLVEQYKNRQDTLCAKIGCTFLENGIPFEAWTYLMRGCASFMINDFKSALDDFDYLFKDLKYYRGPADNERLKKHPSSLQTAFGFRERILAEIPQLQIDRNQLERVINNLCSLLESKDEISQFALHQIRAARAAASMQLFYADSALNDYNQLIDANQNFYYARANAYFCLALQQSTEEKSLPLLQLAQQDCNKTLSTEAQEPATRYYKTSARATLCKLAHYYLEREKNPQRVATLLNDECNYKDWPNREPHYFHAQAYLVIAHLQQATLPGHLTTALNLYETFNAELTASNLVDEKENNFTQLAVNMSERVNPLKLSHDAMLQTLVNLSKSRFFAMAQKVGETLLKYQPAQKILITNLLLNAACHVGRVPEAFQYFNCLKDNRCVLKEPINTLLKLADEYYSKLLSLENADLELEKIIKLILSVDPENTKAAILWEEGGRRLSLKKPVNPANHPTDSQTEKSETKSITIIDPIQSASASVSSSAALFADRRKRPINAASAKTKSETKNKNINSL